MEDTLRAEQSTLETIIHKNCLYKHPNELLPEKPWFMTKAPSEKVASILRALLLESKRKASTFAKKAAAAILIYKEEKNTYEARRATYLRENIDIRNIHKEVEGRIDDQNTIVSLKVFKAQSKTFGPITTSFHLNGNQTSMEEGDSQSFEGKFDDSLKLDFCVDDYGEKKKVGNVIVYFQGVFSDLNYTTIASKEEFTTTIKKEKPDYTVFLEVKVELSKAERATILHSFLVESEKQLAESDEDANLYEAFLRVLSIQDQNGTYESMLNLKEERRENKLCECCRVF